MLNFVIRGLKVLAVLCTLLLVGMGLDELSMGAPSVPVIKQLVRRARRDDAVRLADEALRARTEEFRKRHAEGETLDQLLPEAFAAVQEVLAPLGR